MFRSITIAACAALALSGCTATGGVDWDKVGVVALGTVAVVGAVALGVGAGMAASQPQPVYYYRPPVTCTSYGDIVVTTTCR